MKTNPKGIALLYIKDTLYVKLHQNQVWSVTARTDGKFELKHGCLTIVLDDDAYSKFFNRRDE